MRRSRAATVVALALSAVVAGSSGAAAAPGDPAPGSPEYLARDAQNVADAYGRQTAPDGQLSPEYGLAGASTSTRSSPPTCSRRPRGRTVRR